MDKPLEWNEAQHKARIIQEQITDEVIEDAFSRLPQEVQDETIDKIKSKLKARLALLDETARDYHNYLEKITLTHRALSFLVLPEEI